MSTLINGHNDLGGKLKSPRLVPCFLQVGAGSCCSHDTVLSHERESSAPRVNEYSVLERDWFPYAPSLPRPGFTLLIDEDAVTHQECVMLHRVLSDKSRLPSACLASPSALVQNVSAQPSKHEEGGGGLTTLVRRVTEAVSGATQTKKGEISSHAHYTWYF